ncbi:Ig-like domain-containing protein [Limnohabitans sp. Bal53]|uniref:Ig-like domain-containing protein n=1 Tax=Limnohabitans sp. Bal53 TaxID=1977910 RepID=UPI000D3B7D1A|nr:Ig-like domain-containing protein [Limnohabitans sp. Bal53]PUE40223.1 hypothetical protein B9Z50_12255 [Limnohabitans sp. Bal53]
MAKQYKVLVNTGKADNNKVLDIQQGGGDRGQAVRIKAQAGAKYELQEVGRKKPVGPDYIKAKRVGKDLHILFEDERQASLVIEDYYEVLPEGYNGVIGQAENGSFYEYIPEDPKVSGLISELAEGGQTVNAALGGAEVTPVGAALGVLAFSPLMGILGLGALGAIAAAADGQGDKTPNTDAFTGQLDSGSDSGVAGDHKTNDATPTLSGKVPVGSTASVTINGQKYPVTVNPDGSWTFTNPTNLPDGTYYPVLHVTQNGVTSDINITPFTIDTTAPTVVITSNANILGSGQSATITFTLSEASNDLARGDITVTGGSLGTLTQSTTDPKVYTATFTPNTTGNSATISIANDKFSDAAANRNADGADANNTVTLSTNAATYGALEQAASNDSGVLGDNQTNDTTPTITGKVPAGSTASVTINGQKYPVTVNPDGSWSFTNPTNLPDGTYTPVLDVITNGQTNSLPLTPFTIDTTPPTIVVGSSASVLTTGQSTTVTFTLSEPVSDFDANDIAVTGGNLSNFQKSATDPKVYTATFTPSATGTSASISVASGKFSDAAANLNADGAEANNTVSLITNAASSGQLNPISDNNTGTPNDSKTNDVTPELNGRIPPGSSATISLNGQTYPVTVNPDGTWRFTQPTNLPDGTYTPQLNVTTNGQTVTTPITPFTIDTTSPTVAISGPSTLSQGQSTTLTFTLSEVSTDFTDADLVISGGSLGPLQQSATNPLVYTATFTASPNVDLLSPTSGFRVSIASNKFADAAGNQNQDGAQANNNWVAIESSSDGSSTPTQVPSKTTTLILDPIATDNFITSAERSSTTTLLSGQVNGTYVKGDVVTLVVNGQNYTAAVDALGAYSVSVPTAQLLTDPDTKVEASIAATGATGKPTASQDYTLASTTGQPAVALVLDTVTDDNIINIDESKASAVAMTGKAIGNFTTGDVVTLSVNGKTFTGTVNASGAYSINVPGADLLADPDSTVQASIAATSPLGKSAASALQDYASDTDISPASKFMNFSDFMAPSAPAANFAVFDNVGPVNGQVANNSTIDDTLPAITGRGANPGDVVTVFDTYILNGQSITQEIGKAIVAADGTWSVLPTKPLITGDHLFNVGFTDKVGNSSVGDGTSNFTIGGDAAPAIAIARTSAAATTGAALTTSETIVFTLSRASTNFALSDVDVTGGTLSNFTPVPSSGTAGAGYTQYTATFTPTAGATGTATIGVLATKFTDTLGNNNVDTYQSTSANYETNNQVSIAYNTSANPLPDTTAPSIIVSRAGSATLASGNTDTISFILSEASTSLTASDIDVTGGTLGVDSLTKQSQTSRSNMSHLVIDVLFQDCG